jgi:catechol 2,3-dioxygenase-like lactoylglutathione lyase family enzyme
MRWLPLLAASAVSLFAQLPAPNEAGVSMGHMHIVVKDPEAQKRVWVDVLGAQASKAGPLELLKLPGVFIIVSKAQMDPTGGSNGSSVNHLGFLVKDYADIKAKLAAANIPLVIDIPANKQIIANFPEDVRIEFNEDPKLDVPVTMHHIHLSVTDPEAERAWYVKTFGATAGSRRNLPAAMIPGGEVDFLKANMPQAPTKGRSLDHIGFEVKNLEAFCRKLQDEGMTLDMPYRDVPQIGLHIAFITDPVGTRIELTEGLAAH